MGKRSDISHDMKVKIETLLKTGIYSQRQIARMVKVSQKTVNRLAQSVKAGIPSTSRRKFCRGIKKTSERQDRLIVKTALENRKATVSQLLKILRPVGIHISERTLRSRLYAANIKCRRPAKKPRLTPKMKKARLEWAKLHRNFTVEDWRRVNHD